jgi:hypothetical protein
MSRGVLPLVTRIKARMSSSERWSTKLIIIGMTMTHPVYASFVFLVQFSVARVEADP